MKIQKVIRYFKTSSALMLFTVSGLFLAIPFVTQYTGIVGIAGLIIFLFAVHKSKDLYHVFFGGWLAGSIYSGASIIWFWSTYPLDAFAVNAPALELALVFLYWFPTSVVLGLGTASVSVAIYITRNYWTYRVGIFLFPFVLGFFLVSGELLGSLLFSIYSIGPGGNVESTFSFNYLGYSLIDLPLLRQIASYAGVYSLTFMFGAISGVLFVLQKSGRSEYRNQSLISLGIIISITLVTPFVVKSDTAEGPVDKEIIIVDTAFNSEFFLEQDSRNVAQREVLKAVETALLEKPDIIVLPEDSRLVMNFDSKQETLEHLSNITDTDTIIFDSARTPVDDFVVLRAFVIDLGKQDIYTFDKQNLVPQGEFVPYLHGFFISLFADPALEESVRDWQQYRPGPIPKSSVKDKDIPGLIFCFESVVPTSIFSMQKTAPRDLIVHPISHSWFHDPDILWMQLDRMLITQAMWNDVEIISAGNMAENKRYSPTLKPQVRKLILEHEYWKLHKYEI